MVSRRQALALSLTAGFSSPATGIKLQSDESEPYVQDVLNKSSEPYVQELLNLADIQYYGQLGLGDQQITGLLDTGSFELLVFGETCTTCGKAVAYHHSESRTYRSGNQSETHSFGSGTTYSKDGYDTVSIGPFRTEQMPFWEVFRAQMPVLEQASFQGVIGIGPPGEPVETVQAQINETNDRIHDLESKGDNETIPADLLQQKHELEEKLAIVMSKPSLLEGLGVSVFSQCLGRHPGSAGWLVWNDALPANRPEKFVELPVAGALTWSIHVTRVFFAGGTFPAEKLGASLGCDKGCGTIIDTGTSLFSLPTHVYQNVYNFLKSMDGDCNDLSAFPDLVFETAGHNLSFPPSSYLGQVKGVLSNQLKEFMHPMLDVAYGSAPAMNSSAPAIRLQKESRTRCQLSMMDMGEELTQLGPLAILGMPFFREFYTTFNLGTKASEKSGRRMYIARANEQCRPEGGEEAAAAMHHTRNMLRQIDLEKLRGPRYPRTGGMIQI